MTRIILDRRVYHALEREHVSSMRIGFLAGHSGDGAIEVLGYTMLPLSKSLVKRNEPPWWSDKDVCQRVIPEAAVELAQCLGKHELALVGVILQVEAEIPRYFLEDVGRMLTVSATAGIVLSIEDRRMFTGQTQRHVIVHDWKTLAPEKLQASADLRAAGDRRVEAALDAYWRGVDAKESRRRSTLRCLLDPRLEQQLLGFVDQHTEGEVGGVLLGTRDRATTRIACAVFGPQRLSAALACEFDSGTLQRICDILESLNSSSAEPLQPVGWVHTHPGLGVFFSETDIHTFHRWARLDPLAVAMVLDPKTPLNKRYLLNGAMREIGVEDRALSRWAQAAELCRQLSDPPQANAGVWSVIDSMEINRIDAAQPRGGRADHAPSPENRQPTRSMEVSCRQGVRTSSGAYLMPERIIDVLMQAGLELPSLWLAVGDADKQVNVVRALVSLPTANRAGVGMNELVQALMEHSLMPLTVIHCENPRAAGLDAIGRSLIWNVAREAGVDPTPDSLYRIAGSCLWSTSLVRGCDGISGNRRHLPYKRLKALLRSRSNLAQQPLYICDDVGLTVIDASEYSSE